MGNGQLISQTRGTTGYYLTDAQGSTRALTDTSGAVVESYDYTAYGDLLQSISDPLADYLYTGQRYDATTEQYYLRATDPAECQRLRDEIDAIVAHLYGLSSADFDHIPDTFPQAFPETDAGWLKRRLLALNLARAQTDAHRSHTQGDPSGSLFFCCARPAVFLSNSARP